LEQAKGLPIHPTIASFCPWKSLASVPSHITIDNIDWP
jgi:hypothetical protein